MSKKLNVVLLLCALSNLAVASTVEELGRRVDILERQGNEHEAWDVNSQVDGANEAVAISGYADVEYHYADKRNFSPGFRLHHMSLFFEKAVDNWHFFSEIEYEDAPLFLADGQDQPPLSAAQGQVVDSANGKIFLEALNIDYLWRNKYSFRLGRFFTPAGIWSIDHYPPFVPTQRRPAHIRKIFPQVVDGAQLRASMLYEDVYVDYTLYFGNGEGNSGSGDANATKAIGAKVTILPPWLDGFELGGSFYRDTTNDKTDKEVFGLHARINWKPFRLQAEYADGKCTPLTAEIFHRRGYYTQFLYDINRWTFGYRYDYYDPDDRQPPMAETRNSLIVNYHLTKDMVVKLEHHLVDFEDAAKEDFNESIASVAVYLGQ